MSCKNCNVRPVTVLPTSGIKLCKSCFIRYFEKKVFKTISKYRLVSEGDHIGVACSGGKDSFALLYLLNKLAEKKRKLRLTVISIDEGIDGYRNLSNVRDYCRENGLNLKIASFSKEFNAPLDKMVKDLKTKPCSICGTLRRYLLNKTARSLKVDKLATGHNLDDESQSILMNEFKANLAVSARLGPLTGVIRDKRFIPRIKPLYFMKEKEVATYSFIKGFPVQYDECPYTSDAFRYDVQKMLNNLEQKYPEIKYSIIKSFLEIQPYYKQIYSNSKLNECEMCSEPCSAKVCKACQILEKLSKA